MRVTIGLITFLVCLIGGPVDGQPSILNKTRTVEVSYEIKDLPGLNSSRFEFSPTFFQDKMVFTSDREYDMVNMGENMWKKRAKLNLFVVDIKAYANDSLEFTEAELFSPKFQCVSHSGPISFSKDGNRAVFTQVTHRHPKGYKGNIHRPALFMSSLENGKWKEPVKLSFVDDLHSFGHPYLTPDGNTLYFSSNIEGGQGGDDIYVSSYNGEIWSKPINIGPTVNSDKNEVFPCVHEEVLYFSSNGHNSIGGLDVFKGRIENGKINSIEPLGAPMNSVADDFGIVFKSKDVGYISSNRQAGEGQDDIYLFKVKETIKIESNFLAGEFNYKNLDGKPSNMKVMLLDTIGEFLFETFTNEDGQFIFKNLEPQGDYRIKMEGEEPMELTIFNQNGERVAKLMSDSKGEFTYRLLEQGKVGTLSLIDTEDIKDGIGELNGQFVYESLPNKYASKLKVMLVDESGLVIDETYTDEFGNFEFKNLPSNENYMVRMAEIDNGLTLMIFNKDDYVSAILRMDRKGDFVYKRLAQKYTHSLSMLDIEDDKLFLDESTDVYGQFMHKTLGQRITKSMMFEIVDTNGLVIWESETNDEGYFRLSNLPIAESYMFRMEEESTGDLQLIILNRKGQQIAILDKDKNGFFVYTPLGLSGGISLEQMTTENLDIKLLAKVPTIYYDKGSSALSSESKKELNDLIIELKEHANLKVEVNSYADSRASAEFNLKLSGKRSSSVLNYLKKKGISPDRIGGNAYGESKLLNDCGDGVDCPESLHQLNRRSEIRVY